MSEQNKTTTMAIIAVIAVLLLGFTVYRMMSKPAVDNAEANAEVRKAVTNAQSAPPPASVDTTTPSNAMLPAGKGRRH